MGCQKVLSIKYFQRKTVSISPSKKLKDFNSTTKNVGFSFRYTDFFFDIFSKKFSFFYLTFNTSNTCTKYKKILFLLRNWENLYEIVQPDCCCLYCAAQSLSFFYTLGAEIMVYVVHVVDQCKTGKVLWKNYCNFWVIVWFYETFCRKSFFKWVIRSVTGQ